MEPPIFLLRTEAKGNIWGSREHKTRGISEAPENIETKGISEPPGNVKQRNY
jgi:hypothetical protein